MPGSDNAPGAVKILISGGFGVGKTSMVAAISEITPMRTEELLTIASAEVDKLAGIEGKATTTVALDFGRITLTPDLVLYLFGTPGQQRFWFMWNDLSVGALGAVVLVDTRRIETSFAAIDFFEKRGIPFIIAANCFNGQQSYTVEQVRTALAANAEITMFDARDRSSCHNVLLTLLDHVIAKEADGVRGANGSVNDGEA